MLKKVLGNGISFHKFIGCFAGFTKMLADGFFLIFNRTNLPILKRKEPFFTVSRSFRLTFWRRKLWKENGYIHRNERLGQSVTITI